MKALITGAKGQLGRELCRTAPDHVAIAAFTHQELDIADEEAVARAVADIRPDVIVNAAAFTAVDRAETEREAAFAANATGARNVARAAANNRAWLVQVSGPTWTRPLAEVIWQAAEKRLTGLHHWSDAGVASWYDFAVAIQDVGLELGLLDRRFPVRPIATEDYPTPAHRPSYSVLDSSELREMLNVTPAHWRESLRGMLRELKEQIGCEDSS